MKQAGLVVAALLLMSVGFLGGWTLRGHQKPADDMWWAQLNFPYSVYGPDLGRDATCRNDVNLCVAAIECERTVDLKHGRPYGYTKSDCLAAFTAHPTYKPRDIRALDRPLNPFQ